MKGPFELQRFVDAQNPEYSNVLAELRRGRKTSHWMWFVFPQLKGLGSSPNAHYFGIASRAEAAAYLGHPLLGPRLRECTALVNQAQTSSAEEIFGPVDAMKFHSSMTLFAEVSRTDDDFQQAIDKYFGGEKDLPTLNRLRSDDRRGPPRVCS